ncbi:fumarylacetoacetate hydrolase family protein [Actinomadura sp. 7K507]|uniref:fumarylacetoacetate hydrolase family protein n=1 Tax=Actinomadura sp. 7K507 TaxID=2530365 RepID=UPI001A9D8221|nr:fumarylacetoacetate hydrolase family protein [Actinomadura sp. 7K507]
MSADIQSSDGPAFRLGAAIRGDGRTVVVESRGSLYDLAELVPAAPPASSVLDLVESGWDAVLDGIADALAGGPAAKPLDEGSLRWEAPVMHPRKLICIGTNYKDHIREMGFSLDALSAHPYSFLAPPTTTLVGTGQRVAVPAIAERIDWEAEVALVIGRRTRNVEAADALGHVAGFAVLNDLSARDWSGPNAPAVGIDWVMAKAHDGFKPMAPFVTPARFIAAPEKLWVRSWVNGRLKQDGSTSDMVFDFWQIIEHLSRIMTLEPGDVVATGTPAGVGHGRRPPEYLTAGDHVAVEVESLGRVETTLTGPDGASSAVRAGTAVPDGRP